jgi:hypothetical protein
VPCVIKCTCIYIIKRFSVFGGDFGDYFIHDFLPSTHPCTIRTCTWFDHRLKRHVVKPMVEEVGFQDSRHFSPGERFSMSKKRVVRRVSSFFRRETTQNCSLVRWAITARI